jgi:peptidoglycan hydrolase CwlO-like protein
MFIVFGFVLLFRKMSLMQQFGANLASGTNCLLTIGHSIMDASFAELESLQPQAAAMEDAFKNALEQIEAEVGQKEIQVQELTAQSGRLQAQVDEKKAEKENAENNMQEAQKLLSETEAQLQADNASLQVNMQCCT